MTMANTLIPGRLGREFKHLANKKAKLGAKEDWLVERFNSKTGDRTIREAIEAIEENGKPSEKEDVKWIKDRYEKGERLEFDEIYALEKLYKACGTSLPNKEEDNDV